MLAAIALAAAVAAADCEAMKAEALPAIERANQGWIPALQAHDGAAIAAAYAEDGVFVEPDGAMLAGRRAVADFYASTSKTVTVTGGGIDSQGLACGARGLLYEWGEGRLKLRGKDGREVERGGPYLTVWKRIGPDWKIVRNLAF